MALDLDRSPPSDLGLRPGPAYRFTPRVWPLGGALADLEPAEALSRLRDRRSPVLLDSAGGSPRRFSLLAWDPLPPPPPRGLPGLRERLGRLEDRSAGRLPPGFPDVFRGGFLGALAYDLGVAGEEMQSLPAEPWGQPRAVGGLYVDFLVRDEVAGRNWLVLAEDPGDGRPCAAVRREEIVDALARPHPAARAPRSRTPLARCVSSEEHRDRIERAREAIAAGDIYQANLAHRLLREVEGDPVDLYLRLRRCNPGPYAGFARFEGGAILAASPELLLELDRDEEGPVARTRPIKGTIPRGATPDEDRENAARLLASEKDLAELAMIVDLERNDLGRVARAGSVRVEAFPRLESYASVHHLVADVTARPEPGRDAVDVLAALFPGGSITGAPKLASMEVIAELEGEGRGFSYGSMGMIDLAGRARWNILIRTLLWRPRPDRGEGVGEVAFRVGGGITWGSVAADEEEESLAKGRALERALEGEPLPARVSRATAAAAR